MSAPLHLPTLLIRISEATQAARMRTTPASLARLLRVNRSALGDRRSNDPDAWTARELLSLIAYDSELREDVLAALADTKEPGEPLAVPGDLRELVRRSGRTIEHLMTRLEDERVTVTEARASLSDLLELREAIDVAIRDLKALIKSHAR